MTFTFCRGRSNLNGERQLSSKLNGNNGSVAVSDLRNITVGLQPQSSHSLIMLNSNQLKLR